jgi:trehalose 6-phosphate phosphatase
MKHILSRSERELLARFAQPGTLLAFDYDGTLAPFLRDQDRARLRPRTRRRLAEAAAIFPTVIISGRARDDVRRLITGTGVREVVGNHGIEPWNAIRSYEVLASSWRRALDRRLSGEPGVAVKDKRFSLAVFFRSARGRTAVVAAASALRGARVFGGKGVLNIVPRSAPNKGAALEEALARLGCAYAIYVGDDLTDEDVFALGEKDRILGIRVGRRKDTGADYFLRDQGEIDDLLEALVRLRRELGESRRPVALA